MDSNHTRDEHCTVDREINGCNGCGADHSGPACPDCGGVAYHTTDCPVMADLGLIDEQSESATHVTRGGWIIAANHWDLATQRPRRIRGLPPGPARTGEVPSPC